MKKLFLQDRSESPLGSSILCLLSWVSERRSIAASRRGNASDSTSDGGDEGDDSVSNRDGEVARPRRVRLQALAKSDTDSSSLQQVHQHVARA